VLQLFRAEAYLPIFTIILVGSIELAIACHFSKGLEKVEHWFQHILSWLYFELLCFTRVNFANLFHLFNNRYKQRRVYIAQEFNVLLGRNDICEETCLVVVGRFANFKSRELSTLLPV
jgi:hypothetical protein